MKIPTSLVAGLHLPRWAYWLLSSVLVACGDPRTEGVELGVNGQAIAGGTIDEDEVWSGVVMLETKMSIQGILSSQTCSGTLVAPNLVLSALHCVAPLRDDNFQCKPDGTVEQLVPGAGELGSPVAPEEVKIRIGVDASGTEPAAVGKLLITTKSPNICNNDIALVLLDKELDLPLSRLRLDADIAMGEVVTIVGYGTNAVNGDPVARRYIEGIRVSDLGSDLTGNTTSGAPPRTFAVGPSACKGDSGGPAFSMTEDGHPVVAGVDSLIIGDCGSSRSRAVFTRLSPFKKLIQSAFEEAGYPAWEEGQTEPGVYPEPVIPDGGFPEAGADETTDVEEPVKAQRLKTGCTLAPRSTPGALYALGVLPLLLALWARRKTTPTS